VIDDHVLFVNSSVNLDRAEREVIEMHNRTPFDGALVSGGRKTGSGHGHLPRGYPMS
jgi:hypothetical protein